MTDRAGPPRAALTELRDQRVRAARRLAKRSYRTAERRFVAEGPQAVREALATPGAVLEMFVTPAAAERHADLVVTATTTERPVHLASDEVLASLGSTVTPQGVAAVCRFIDVPLGTALDGPVRLVVLLAQVRDPGNAGTVLRIADAAGADAVLLTNSSVDPYNGKCVRASAGSLFHLPLVTGVTAEVAVDAVRASGLRVLAADGRGEHDLDTAADSGELAAPTAWLFGNEAWGLPPQTRALADDVVRVPIHGRAESLNLAAAAAVCLYASARAQR